MEDLRTATANVRTTTRCRRRCCDFDLGRVETTAASSTPLSSAEVDHRDFSREVARGCCSSLCGRCSFRCCCCCCCEGCWCCAGVAAVGFVAVAAPCVSCGFVEVVPWPVVAVTIIILYITQSKTQLLLIFYQLFLLKCIIIYRTYRN